MNTEAIIAILVIITATIVARLVATTSNKRLYNGAKH